jgi:hypothetical protein
MENKLDKLTIFINRLQKIGIKVKLVGNFPWIYMTEVNGNVVKEKLQSEHNFTIAFLPIRVNQELKFTDITEIFKVIRKYK